MKTLEKLKLLKSGKLSAEENIRGFLKEIEKNDQNGKKINAFLQLNHNAIDEAREVDKRIKQKKAGKLAGLAIAVKSNICVQGLRASCASKTLEHYRASFNASVIDKIKEEDGIIIGMTNMDEFACGSSGETSAFGAVKNPQALELIPGGSSSGSAAAVSAGFCDLALGSDTGGSIRNPASHCDVVGVKPSYGLVSRYGLIDLAMSLDQIGSFAKDVSGAEVLLEVIRGRDEKDAVTLIQEEKKPNIFETKEKIIKKEENKAVIGVIRGLEKYCTKEIFKLVDAKIKKLAKEYGFEIKEISPKILDLAVQTYYPLVYVEFFSGTRKFDGRRFGRKIEDVCGKEVLRRIIGGQEISREEYHGTYYRKALMAKQFIKKELEKDFEKVDCIILPSVPRLPHKLNSKISVKEMYGYDMFTIPANLAGICAMSLPAGKIDKVPVGIQVMCKSFEEDKMFDIAKKLERL
ncbi:Asp-tRNA(Asn)/Glu-tRNA(Gln) amidotransferase GatCAB subunit A [Candidatus Woesearchaeota archaeon CG10_big_fil_rev_8_21_14_0_10_34_12]|nr:MAG: Asp-tRNA(Asn)/Glu-tRNA(Gln) amidotransferase GatCAB subunit A [Candidatus Woesearchaeota archaeon CG10_big_fil_rev_8_21_14_0_10_34_12]